MRRKRLAFTLVELLVVIGIIAVLIGILVPMLARARKAARQAVALNAMRDMMYGYIAYHTAHQGQVLWGYPPAYINGQLVRVGLPTGQTLPTPNSGSYGELSLPIMRYPARMAPYVQDLWAILYNHEEPEMLPGVGDTTDQAAEKVYKLSLYPTFGLNSIFMGGDTDFEGFAGFAPNARPVHGKHAAFRAREIRRVSDQIVFVECQENTTAGRTDHGYFRAMPPLARGRRWQAGPSGDSVQTVMSGQFGIPMGRWSKRAVTGFFDGHAAPLTIGELDDMRLWAKDANKKDYDYSSTS